MIKANKKLYFCLTVLSLALFSTKCYAISASADMGSGYSGEVLTKVLQNYTKTPDASGYAQVLVRIGRDGRPFSCEMVKESKSYRADEAICIAVAMAQQFPIPPNNAQSAEVYLTFVYDDQLVLENNTPQILLSDTLGSQYKQESFTPFSSESSSEQYSENAPTYVGEKYNDQDFETAPYVAEYSDKIFLAENNVESAQSSLVSEAHSINSELFSPNETLPIEVEANTPSTPEYTHSELSSPNSSQIQQNTASLSYAERIMANAQKLLNIPEDLPLGNYAVQVKLRIDDTGKLINYTTLEPSQSPIFDEHIKEVLLSDGVIPKPDSGNQEVILSFEANKQ